MNYQILLDKQKSYFRSGATRPIAFRLQQLKKLKEILRQNEEKLNEAIYRDFKKSAFDTYTTEIGFLLKDIDYYLKHTRTLASAKRVRTNLANMWGRSTIYQEPLGSVLVIGAWNYPYQLSLSPAIAAIAAGNTAIIKPSETAPATMKMMAELINNNFDEAFLKVITADENTGQQLTQLSFDKIFFTGSTATGRKVYEAAAKNLVPVTLELSGKSPAFISASADLEIAAKRIVWGKFLNAGQTCVAPDYILVHESVTEKLLKLLVHCIEKFDYNAEAAHYTQIINEKEFSRLQKLLNRSAIYYGGETHAQQRYMAPTLIFPAKPEDEIMQEEIFGPLLPILTYKDIRDALDLVSDKPAPLSAYLFSNDKKEQEQFINNVRFGGGCINDTIMHLSNPNLPFGGVGNSGLGSYHGKFGFETFSHQKGILKRATWGEPNLKYPPYTQKKFSWIRKLLG